MSQSSIVVETLAGGNRTPTVLPLVFRASPQILPNSLEAIIIASYTTTKVK